MAQFHPPSPLFLPPLGFRHHVLVKLGSDGRSESAPGYSWRVVLGDLNALEAPAPRSILPWKQWELFPASCILAKRTGVLRTSPSWKSSLAPDYAAGLEFGIGPVFENDRGSGGLVTDLARSYPIR